MKVNAFLGKAIFGFILFLLVTICASVAVAQDTLPNDNGIFDYHRSPRYRESESHPLRILAYVGHPIGWVLREAIFRPWSALAGSTEFTRSFFGFREPYDYRDPMCFNASEEIPDCHDMAPYNALIKVDGGVEGDGGSDTMVSERQIYFPDVAFDFDKASLNDLGKGRVRQISQLLASVPSLKVVVEGHADYKGSDEYNAKLGTSRAEAVIKELAELGIDPARMSPVSYGESRPIFTEEEDWARAVNRRVQFSVQGEQAAVSAEGAALEPAEKNS